MKVAFACIASVATLAAMPAGADAYDCFPLCFEATAVASARIALCEFAVVREAARIDREMAPLKAVYAIATNPAGFAIAKVSEQAGVRIPPWVGYAMDPQGALRAKVMKEVRRELKKQVGLQDHCRAELDEASSAEDPSREGAR